jgi:hypothetical protein
MSTSNKLPLADYRLKNINNALYVDGNDDIVMRTGFAGNIVISGNVNVPGTITVNSTPEDPIHNHITEVGTSGTLTNPWLPVAGNVRLDAGINSIGNVRITDGSVSVTNFPAFPSNVSITQMPAITGNVTANVTFPDVYLYQQTHQLTAYPILSPYRLPRTAWLSAIRWVYQLVLSTMKD